MKIIRVNKHFNFINNSKGMMLLEFLIVLFISLSVTICLIEFGFVLRSEAVVIASTKELVRSVMVKGVLEEIDENVIINKIEAQRCITETEIKLFKKNYGSNLYVTANIGDELGFRQDFKVLITAKHTFKANGLFGATFDIPLMFSSGGRVERYKYH